MAGNTKAENRPLRAAAVATALVVGMLVAGCTGGEPDSDTSQNTNADRRIAAAKEMSKSDQGAVCDAIRSGVETFAGSSRISVDDVPQREDCYVLRGSDKQNFAQGIARIHQLDAADVKKYRKALKGHPQGQTECFIYRTLTSDKDEQFNQGPTSFSDVNHDGEKYCQATDPETVVLSFAITGAVIVIELGVSGELNGHKPEVEKLRAAVIPAVFRELRK